MVMVDTVGMAGMVGNVDMVMVDNKANTAVKWFSFLIKTIWILQWLLFIAVYETFRTVDDVADHICVVLLFER